MTAINHACDAIAKADSLLITSGAGMGVDSGLPDFRGREGFWKAYPALARSGINFQEIASPASFKRDPLQAWGFYGHRLNLYRETVPHQGFAILQDIAREKANGCFVVTSNVDGQFQKVGFDHRRIYEVHGSIHHLQCINECRGDIWSADGFVPTIDPENCTLISEFPRCPYCNEIARPNILMFNDWSWRSQRSRSQALELHDWLQFADRLVVIELGAGTDIPTIRDLGERQNGCLIRINPRDADVPGNGISIPLGALEALTKIRDELLGRRT